MPLGLACKPPRRRQELLESGRKDLIQTHGFALRGEPD
jgi:hypothetical protein